MEDVWERFYRENYRVVYGYLLSLCADRETAEDLAADTFLRAYERIGRYDGSCKPSTWLCQIGKNLWFNERKRRLRREKLDRVEEGSGPSPEETAAQRDALDRLFRAAEALPEMSRQVFRMRLAGLSFKEVGQALGRSENWARVTSFRAKNQVLESGGYHEGL